MKNIHWNREFVCIWAPTRPDIKFVSDKQKIFRFAHDKANDYFLRLKWVFVLPSLILCFITLISHFAYNNALLQYSKLLAKLIHRKHKHHRWSRGHKARCQGQGHKKNPRPRPRPAFPRTEPLDAKDRNVRGQGPKTQPQVFSNKKGLQKSFSCNLQFIRVARILDWSGLNHKSHAMTSSKICLLAVNSCPAA